MGAAILRTPEGTILHWSAGCERLFGFPATEALGRTAHELLGTRFPDGGRRALAEELLQHGRVAGRTAPPPPQRPHVVVASHWILRRDPADGRPAAVLELHTDATALKAAEAALRAGEARLRLAQEVAGVGTWEWDPEEDSFVWSPEHYALFGLSPRRESRLRWTPSWRWSTRTTATPSAPPRTRPWPPASTSPSSASSGRAGTAARKRCG